jgi:hypothetical protein
MALLTVALLTVAILTMALLTMAHGYRRLRSSTASPNSLRSSPATRPTSTP